MRPRTGVLRLALLFAALADTTFDPPGEGARSERIGEWIEAQEDNVIVTAFGLWEHDRLPVERAVGIARAARYST